MVKFFSFFLADLCMWVGKEKVGVYSHSQGLADTISFFFYFNFLFFFGCTVWLTAGSEFPNQGLNLGHGSESAGLLGSSLQSYSCIFGSSLSHLVPRAGEETRELCKGFSLTHPEGTRPLPLTTRWLEPVISLHLILDLGAAKSMW